jgi:hypothetical protein
MPLYEPYDTFFCRWIRSFIKCLQNCVRLLQELREFASLGDAIELHWLSAPIFEDVLHYTWYTSKLTSER